MLFLENNYSSYRILFNHILRKLPAVRTKTSFYTCLPCSLRFKFKHKRSCDSEAISIVADNSSNSTVIEFSEI